MTSVAEWHSSNWWFFLCSWLLGTVQVELEADAEATLLVCPRSPALASANQKSQESMSNAFITQREKYTASTADCELCGLPRSIWKGCFKYGQYYEIWISFCLKLSPCLGLDLEQGRWVSLNKSGPETTLSKFLLQLGLAVRARIPSCEPGSLENKWTVHSWESLLNILNQVTVCMPSA